MTFLSMEVAESPAINKYCNEQMYIYLSGYGTKLLRGDVDTLEHDIDTPVRRDPVENGKVIALYKMWLQL